MKVLCSCGREYWPMQAWIHARCTKAVNDIPAVQEGVTDEERVVNKTESSAGVSRQVKWQQENRDRYNAKMREAMRKRRERARAGLGG